MHLLLVTPVPRTSRKGNRITTDRWEHLLTELGHDVKVDRNYADQTADAMLALHARRSAESVRRFREDHPESPVVLALTGTDVYRDIHENDAARETLSYADRFIVLQPEARKELPERYRQQVHVVYQSISDVPDPVDPKANCFEVCVIGHLRSVKDPFRTEEASRLLPKDSTIQVTHVGGELEEGMAAEARERMENNPRYEWTGEQPRDETLRVISRSRLLVHSSRMEGGAHAISEAIACETPVLASEIPGNVGLLGPDYPGYYPVGSSSALAAKLRRAETDSEFYRRLQEGVRSKQDIVKPAHERKQLKELFNGLALEFL